MREFSQKTPSVTLARATFPAGAGKVRGSHCLGVFRSCFALAGQSWAPKQAAYHGWS